MGTCTVCGTPAPLPVGFADPANRLRFHRSTDSLDSIRSASSVGSADSFDSFDPLSDLLLPRRSANSKSSAPTPNCILICAADSLSVSAEKVKEAARMLSAKPRTLNFGHKYRPRLIAAHLGEMKYGTKMWAQNSVLYAHVPGFVRVWGGLALSVAAMFVFGLELVGGKGHWMVYYTNVTRLVLVIFVIVYYIIPTMVYPGLAPSKKVNGDVEVLSLTSLVNVLCPCSVWRISKGQAWYAATRFEIERFVHFRIAQMSLNGHCRPENALIPGSIPSHRADRQLYFDQTPALVTITNGGHFLALEFLTPVEQVTCGDDETDDDLPRLEPIIQQRTYVMAYQASNYRLTMVPTNSRRWEVLGGSGSGLHFRVSAGMAMGRALRNISGSPTTSHPFNSTAFNPLTFRAADLTPYRSRAEYERC